MAGQPASTRRALDRRIAVMTPGRTEVQPAESARFPGPGRKYPGHFHPIDAGGIRSVLNRQRRVRGRPKCVYHFLMREKANGGMWAAWLLALVGAIAVAAGLALQAGSSSAGDPSQPPAGLGAATAGTSTRVEGETAAGSAGMRHDLGLRRPSGIEDSITGPVLPESVPTTVRIARIGVASKLVGLGLDDAGSMEVPTDPAQAGWYTEGPSPGSLGPAIVVGHVTWNGEPGVFFKLGRLRRGDNILVQRADERNAVFSVRRVATFSKDRFPTQAVFGAIDHAGLRLITCGGLYDESAHRYLRNVVVFADLIRVRTRP